MTSASSNNASMQASARATLVSLVKEHATTLIREAISVSRHAKRARIYDRTGEDGWNGRPLSTRRRIHAADINMALQLIGCEKLYASNIVAPRDAENEDGPPDSQKRVNLADFLRQEADSMPNPPSELGISMHWLAVDGTQPEIPQNPSTVGFGAAAGSGVPPVLLDDDDSDQQAGDSHAIQVNQLQNSLLSEELQLYFTRVTLATERGSSTADHRRQQDAVIVSVSRDAGLQELVPFLVRYCQREIYKHVGNAEHCRLLVRLAAALLHNPNIHLELQLHELLPALMTCVVAKRLAPSGNHWALRREAGAVLVQACNLFGDEYPTLKARVLRTLCDAVAPGKTLPSRYGGIVTISYFGSKAVDAFLLPTALGSWRRWEMDLQETKDLAEAHEIQMCQQAMLDALGIFFRRSSLEEKAERVVLEELEDTLGDKWIVFQDESYPYATCFV